MSLQEEDADPLSFSSSSKRQRTSGPACKHLYVCLMPLHDMSPELWFSVQSIPVARLVGDTCSSSSPDYDPIIYPSSSDEYVSIYPQEVQQQPLMNQVFYFQNAEDKISSGTGFIFLGDKLYSFGGQLRDANSRKFSHLWDAAWSRESMCFDFSAMRNGSRVRPSSYAVKPSQIQPMQSWKPCPIVAEIDGLIYVLAGTPFSFRNLPNPFFEVYYPHENSWHALPSPPFTKASWMDEWMDDWECLETYDYSSLVINKKLCVSNQYASFAFNTGTGEWEACELFRGFSDTYYWPERDVRDKYMPDRHQDMDGGGGPPFSFVIKSILYGEDVLICAVSDWGWDSGVVAFQTDKEGRVQRMQLLFKIEEENECERLVDLGGGYMCYQYHRIGSRVLGHSRLTFVPFKVSKIGGGGAVRNGSDSGFLRCERLDTLNQTIKGDLSLHPVYSFAL